MNVEGGQTSPSFKALVFFLLSFFSLVKKYKAYQCFFLWFWASPSSSQFEKKNAIVLYSKVLVLSSRLPGVFDRTGNRRRWMENAVRVGRREKKEKKSFFLRRGLKCREGLSALCY